MRLLQSGIPKSGNFWLWQILQETMREAGLPNESFIQQQPIYPIAKTWELSFAEQAEIDTIDITQQGIYYRISSIFRMPINDLDAYISQTNHVWTHSNFNIASQELFPKFDKVVYILRDPRDVILSQSRFAFTPYRQRYLPTRFKDADEFLVRQIPEMSERWQKHVSQHLLNRQEYNIHIVFYERLLMDFDSEFAKLLDYLGLSLDAEQIARIKQAVQFETMQQANPNHLAKGQSYKWMEKLSTGQQALVLKHSRDLLVLLGYPLTSQDAPNLPSLEGVSQERLKSLSKEKHRRPFLKRLLRRALTVIK